MGDAQSAQRDSKKDAETEECAKVDDALTKENIEDKALQNNGQISEINGKADGSLPEVNCEDEIVAEAILSPDEDVSESEEPLKEVTPLENIEINDVESIERTDANEDVLEEMIKLDAKQNDINEGFKRFFSNIGLKLTVKRGSSEIPTDVIDEPDKKESNRPEDVEGTTKESRSENGEPTYDNDSTTCPTLTDATSEDALETAEDKTTETKEAVESVNDQADTASPVGHDAHDDAQDATPEEEPNPTPTSNPEEEEVVSPIKRFFTTGIFSGMRKKRKSIEEEIETGKEFVIMGEKEVGETTEDASQQQDKDEISQGVEAAAIETEHTEKELKKETLIPASAPTTDEGTSSTTDQSTITVLEAEITNSQEKDKVQASPLRRLLSGSSLKRLSKRHRGSKSSDAKLTDSGEHVSDQLMSSTESAGNQTEGPAQPSVEAAAEEDSAWASFKKLMTPKKRASRPSLSTEETQILGTVEEPKPGEGEQILEHSTEEGKKRKDSSVSWEAVLCGSGRRRSRKTSDSEDETPQNDNDEDGGPKHDAKAHLEIADKNESEMLASSPKQAESVSDGDGGSTWKSLKRLVTPKRKAKDVYESKDNVQSDSEASQDESSFSIKKLLPGRKKRKSAERPDHVSSDEADKDVHSADEDSETPAVVPLSEFDTVETEVQIQTQADVESHTPEQGDNEQQKHLLGQIEESEVPCDSLQNEAEKVEDGEDALEKPTSTTTTITTHEEPDDLSKHQQLSDIPEEGIITETMATPASFAEEAVRDDTIADDLIEITSEAITAPEPVDITLTDETEMISALSQLSSESSKTSGNTTPVPAEDDVKETDVLLQQVVETMSVSPKLADEISSESIPEMCLNIEEVDALAATALTESVSELNDSVSTEIISEVFTEEFESAEITLDGEHQVKVTCHEESIKELQSIDDSHHLVESISEQSGDISPEGEDIFPDEGLRAATVAGGTEDEAMEEKDGAQIMDDSNDQVQADAEEESPTEDIQAEAEEEQSINEIQAEAEDEAPKEEETLQELTAGQTVQLNSEGFVQLLEKNVISENIVAAETVSYQLKEDSVLLTDVSDEPEEMKTDQTVVLAPEDIDCVQASTLHSEESTVQSLETPLISENIPAADTDLHELKEESIPQTADETEHVGGPEEIETVQASTLDSEEGGVQSLEKEVISENIPIPDTDSYELKEESLPQTAEKSEDVHIPDEVETVQASTLDSEEGGVQSLEKQLISENIPIPDTDSYELKEEHVPQTAEKSEDVGGPEEIETVQASTLDSEEGGVQSLEKEVISENIPIPDTDSYELKEESLPQTAEKSEDVGGPEELETVQASTLDSEEGGVQSLEKQLISESSPTAETDLYELKEEHVPQTAEKSEDVGVPEEIETVHASTFDSEEGLVQSLEKEVISENIPIPDTDSYELKEESLPQTAEKSEDVQVPDEVEAVKASPLDSEEGNNQSLDAVIEDLLTVETITDEPKQETQDVQQEGTVTVEAAETECLVTDENETEVVTQLDQTLEISEEQEREVMPRDVLIEQEDNMPEFADELQTLPVVHVSFAKEEASDIQVEKIVCSEETQVPNVDNAAFTDEPKHEVNLGEVQDNVEGEIEIEIPGTEINTASAEHAMVAQVVTCSIKEVSAAISDVLTDQTSGVCELSIEEVDDKTVAPLVRDYVTETAEEGSVVTEMQVPSVEFDDNHRIQVQVVDVDIQSAEAIVDKAQEIGIEETPKVIDVCHETVEKVDNISASAEIEEEFVLEKNRVIVKEGLQLQKDNLPETVPESVDVNLEQEVTQQPDVVTELSELAERESTHIRETRSDEAPAVISVPKDLTQQLDTPGSLKELIHDHKEDMVEIETECEKFVASVKAEQVKSSPEEHYVKAIHEQAQLPQSQSVTHGNTGLVVPQNSGIISSIGNVESPSSLSLEFKLNIQFGQTMAPASPQLRAEIIEPVRQTEMSEVGIQAVEVLEPVQLLKPTQRVESQKEAERSEPVKHTEMSDVGVQAVELAEPLKLIKPTPIAESREAERTEAVKQIEMSEVGVQAVEVEEPLKLISPTLIAESQKEAELADVAVQATEIICSAATDPTKRAVVTAQPILHDVRTQAMKTEERDEEIKSTERETFSVQATATIQPVKQIEERAVFLSQPVLSVACTQGAKAEESVKQVEEETDQDVWLDAEEGIYTQEEKPGVEYEIEMAPSLNTEDEEIKHDMHKTGERYDIESEGEDFAVAPEPTETASTSITTEWD